MTTKMDKFKQWLKFMAYPDYIINNPVAFQILKRRYYDRELWR